MNGNSAPRVAFVAQEAYPYESATEDYASLSYGVRKLEASVRADPALAALETTIIDIHSPDPEVFFEAVRAFRPSIVALSVYIWSLKTFLWLAKRIKEHDPSIIIVMGGPSARASVLALPPYQPFVRYVDAVVQGEGEAIIRALLRHDRSEWRAIPGLLLPHSLGLRTTGEADRIDLDEFPSPYQLGLVPKGRVGYVETFRGCPMSCAFCQWGDARSDRVFGAEYLEQHLRGLADAQATEVFFLDAAFNLSPRAHRNLIAAERKVGALRHLKINGHLYPTHVDESFLELLDTAAEVRVIFGIQSFDPDVLRGMSRPYDPERFTRVVTELRHRLPIEIEIIMGLPGDNPANYRRTVEQACEVADTVRVFYPLVLPDALLERAAALHIEFDPETFRVIRTADWDAAAMRSQWDATVAFAETMPKHVVNETMASFTTRRGAERPAFREPASAALEPLRAALAAQGRSLEQAYYGDRGALFLAVAEGPIRMDLEVERSRPGSPSLVARDGLSYSHRGRLESGHLPAVRSLIDGIHDCAKALVR